jgi:hypothetical protein
MEGAFITHNQQLKADSLFSIHEAITICSLAAKCSVSRWKSSISLSVEKTSSMHIADNEQTLYDSDREAKSGIML